MTTMRSSSGMCAASALSSVVLPVPVPPEIRMFCCVATASVELRRQCRRQRADVDELVEAVAVRELPNGQRPGPPTAHGGNIAATREPSSRRASSSGCISEISSPQARAMFLIATVRFRVSSVRSGTRFERAVALDEHAPAAVVHHHLGDGRDRRSRSSIGLQERQDAIQAAHSAPRAR